MRVRHIEVFNAVMLTGSVSAAARLIHVTQPAVSRTLQHAESQLGFALFRREKGRLTATSEAQALYPHIERIFNQLTEIDLLAASLRKQGRPQELKIATVMALTHEILPRALTAFRVKHPAVGVRVEALHSPQIVSALLLRSADIGFAFTPAPHPALSLQPLAEAALICVAPRGLLPPTKRRQGKVSLKDLAGLPAVAIDSSDPLGLIIAQACRETEIGLKGAITVQTYHAALAMAHHGLGFAIVDAYTAFSADASKVDVLTIDPIVRAPVHALRLTHHPDSVALNTLLRCMKTAMAQAK
jgi:DNA-binding transcriptional LysR family regulator